MINTKMLWLLKDIIYRNKKILSDKIFGAGSLWIFLFAIHFSK